MDTGSFIKALQNTQQSLKRWKKKALSASSQAAENQCSYGDTQVSIEDVQAQLSHVTRERDALQHTVHVAQHKNRGLKCKISALEDEVDNANSGLASVREKIDEFRGKRAKLVEEKAALQKQVNRFLGCMKLSRLYPQHTTKHYTKTYW
jgi:chromosome segregation ATPase